MGAGEEGRSAFDGEAGAMSSRAALQGIIDQLVAKTGGLNGNISAANGNAVHAQ